MKTKLSTLEAINRYQKKNVIQLNIRLNKKTDADIIEILNSISNKQGYIKELIRIDRIHKLMNDASVSQLFEN